MLLFYLRKTKKKNDNIKVQLVYKSSPEANFRLLKALSMLINEKDILEHFQKSSKTKIVKSKRPPIAFITIGRGKSLTST